MDLTHVFNKKFSGKCLREDEGVSEGARGSAIA